MKIYLLEADGTNYEEHHPLVLRSDFAFRTKKAAEKFIPEWRAALLAPTDDDGPTFYESKEDHTTRLTIYTIEVELLEDA